MSWVAVGVGGLGAGAIGTAASKKKKTMTLEEMMTSNQKDAENYLTNYFKQYGGNYTPGASYSGLSTMMTPTEQEQQGLTSLTQLLSSGMPSSLTNAANEVNKQLTGGYDPTTSEYYKASRASLNRERQKALAQAKNQAAAYGYRSSSAERNALGDVETDTYNKVAELIGQLTESERNRTSNAVNQALNVASAQESIPLNRIAASQQYGGLTRTLENVGYQDFLRKQQENAGVLDVANSVLNNNVSYGQKSMPYYQNSAFGDIYNEIIAPLALRAATGGFSS